MLDRVFYGYPSMPGAVRFKSNSQRSGSVRFQESGHLTMQFGAVFIYYKSYGAVRCCDVSYGAVRCGFKK